VWDVDVETIMLAIAELPEGSRIIFNLHLIENYKHNEIAEMLHISESTSKSQYRRAKHLLKEKLTNTNHER
jgi:RNA polymerase sigma-70 factor (ECF subfamily)